MCMSVRVALNLLSVKAQLSSYVQTNSLSISEFGLELDLVPVPSYQWSRHVSVLVTPVYLVGEELMSTSLLRGMDTAISQNMALPARTHAETTRYDGTGTRSNSRPNSDIESELVCT